MCLLKASWLKPVRSVIASRIPKIKRLCGKSQSLDFIDFNAKEEETVITSPQISDDDF